MIITKMRFYGPEYVKVENLGGTICYSWTDDIKEATQFATRDKAEAALKQSGLNAISGITIEEA